MNALNLKLPENSVYFREYNFLKIQKLSILCLICFFLILVEMRENIYLLLENVLFKSYSIKIEI